ncbi:MULTISPECIES: hypothetical protein [Bacillus]|uniref:Uncharacterized protein n=2 Tax=Bacillus thuringiensis TaxID=1428 RepID=A0AAP4Q736_BACTU|nr:MULTISPECIES: hypothetical protein [Bacillus]MEC0046293.1 hypothetical protein [Bacillus cereus]AFV21657.1 hypothetical protein BTB_502p03520 [Bacillus thuringiensis Bt407]EEM25314.1 hypothetical protein bthur0002_59560 [Bacillus thuringiensis Bt407]ERI01167.1 hypothetical protein BTCBT_002722 [Bacillus thuringiensis T01-328]MBN6707920.1 hypothetical protein [Bacillus thuringiensis]
MSAEEMKENLQPYVIENMRRIAFLKKQLKANKENKPEAKRIRMMIEAEVERLECKDFLVRLSYAMEEASKEMDG